MAAVKQEVSDLSQKLADVLASLGDLEAQLCNKSLELASGSRADFAQMVSATSKQLEERVALLEGKFPSKDLSEIGDSLRQVQTVVQSLQGVVSKDVRPKLETHTIETRRLAGDLKSLSLRINVILAGNSLATTSSPTHCLACSETKKQSVHQVFIGRDGKAYQQGNLTTSSGGSELSSAVPSPKANHSAGIIHASNKVKAGGKSALQGGAGAPLRKYRIPVGADGSPTWGLMKGMTGSHSTPGLPAAIDRGRGLPPPCRPQSATLLGQRDSDPRLGTLRLLSSMIDDDMRAMKPALGTEQRPDS